MKNHSIEILAPAGSMEALIAAVRSNADAVYFGAGSFNARIHAENFNNENFEQGIAYCKQHGVKCYLTLNTLIRDDELNQALELAERAYAAGIDALIVQDIGLAKLLHEHLPQIELHASTQMTVVSPAALKTLKNLGFTRVVAARELSKTELQTLCDAAKRLDMQVEVFVHGALCMSVSGQCYFSACLGGRSANRGLCAGTCRLPFYCGQNSHALSLKDLSIIPKLQQLQTMGVASAKIEGRMKRPEYVSVCVKAALESLEQGGVTPTTAKLLRAVFSRNGFTDGYFTAKRGKEMFGARSKEDAIDSATLKSIHEIYRKEPQNIPLDFTLTLTPKSVTLCGTCQNFRVEKTLDGVEASLSADLNYDHAFKTLSKLGGTPYYLNSLNFAPLLGYTVSGGVLNTLKKQVCEQLTSLRTAPRAIAPHPNICFSGEPRRVDRFFGRFAVPEQLPDDLSNFDAVSLPAEMLNAQISAKIGGNKLWAELPRIAFDEAKITAILNQLKLLNISRVVCGNLATVSMALAAGFEVFAGFGLNIFNSAAIAYYEGMGISNLLLSPELSFTQIAGLAKSQNTTKLYAFSYGRLPVMLTRNCPKKSATGCQDGPCSFTDRIEETFLVKCRLDTTEIYNAKTLAISDKLNKLSADGAYLYFTNEDKQTVLKIIKTYQAGEKISGKNYTGGLLQKGVL